MCSKSSQKFFLATPNPEMVLAAQKNPTFKKILNSTQLSVADGIGVLWASYFLSLKKRNLATLVGSLAAIIFAPKKIRSVIPERVTGSDLFPKLLKLAADHKQKVFLLGAAPGIAVKVKTKFEKKFSDLQIVGTYAGSSREGEDLEICQKINESEAEMLFVAFSFPRQELWISRNLPKLNTVRFAAGIGGSFDFYAGVIARAPRIFQKLGLEWLWRLLRQPKRFGRIWNATVRFVRLIFIQRGF
ncbi:WecB/TagA/CpsF family glycosyltransferase [Candidatus Gracilibacteria bacterium]|nr:WecB/TagA/CpsF family glycosyltransferase [Candidatus Gracilibacteria bacterium]MCF7856738.1 WecB/TagA/CpsF family glycosyltransferase [Candidatus Gracilibacteria bacterium]MCF7896946.1 WecB/TagA/CpsF family glycosyltransferase [Candidatus Gracilibacteria bacterium]